MTYCNRIEAPTLDEKWRYHQSHNSDRERHKRIKYHLLIGGIPAASTRTDRVRNKRINSRFPAGGIPAASTASSRTLPETVKSKHTLPGCRNVVTVVTTAFCLPSRVLSVVRHVAFVQHASCVCRVHVARRLLPLLSNGHYVKVQ